MCVHVYVCMRVGLQVWAVLCVHAQEWYILALQAQIVPTPCMSSMTSPTLGA